MFIIYLFILRGRNGHIWRWAPKLIGFSCFRLSTDRTRTNLPKYGLSRSPWYQKAPATFHTKNPNGLQKVLFRHFVWEIVKAPATSIALSLRPVRPIYGLVGTLSPPLMKLLFFLSVFPRFVREIFWKSHQDLLRRSAHVYICNMFASRAKTKANFKNLKTQNTL
jgi:hypothetical protein